MLSRKANFTFKKPNYNELSLISERVNMMKRHRPRSNTPNKKSKYQKKINTVVTKKNC